ncbi:MAG: hypothetical protein ACRC2T_04135 [Thermoguttaceae bacterium]
MRITEITPTAEMEKGAELKGFTKILLSALFVTSFTASTFAQNINGTITIFNGNSSDPATQIVTRHGDRPKALTSKTSQVNGHYVNDIWNRNIVIVNGGIWYDGTVAQAGDIYGGAHTGESTDGNLVIMNGGEVRSVFGAWNSEAVGTGDASFNTVIINGGTVHYDVTGGGNYSASTDIGHAKNNNVIVNSGTIRGNIFGGFSAGGGNALGNNVTINGGNILGNIYGGVSYQEGGTNQTDATQNTVTINGGTFAKTVVLFGVIQIMVVKLDDTSAAIL